MTNDALHQFLERYTKLKEDQNLRPGKDTLTNEFQKIKRTSEKMVIEGQTIATHGAKEVNRRKNRYKDILPFDHSRVILHKHGGQDGTDYINANYIMSPGGKKGYIASQGPMPSTVNDFWQMIWQHKVKVVVMACKEIELGKHRCQRYWPVEREQLNFNNIKVTLVKEEAITSSLCERTLKAADGNDWLQIVQLHYTAWPDHGVPRTTTDLIQMIELMRDRHPWDEPPVLIHCSAGCGRTGVMVAADYGRRLMRKSPETFDVYDLVMTLRKQRPAMVQSKEQYEYLHDVFKDLVEEYLRRPAGQLWSSYMNIDIGGAPLDVHLYENIDMITRASPQPRRRTSPKDDNAKTVMKPERPVDTKKPVITNASPSPQKALINTDSCSPKPKPVPRPVKVLDLMDNETNFHSNSPLQSPLLPLPAQPMQTMEMRKPNPKVNYVPQSSNGSEPTDKRNLKSEKDHTPNTYVNFEIGSSSVSSKAKVSAEKPLSPKMKPGGTFDKQGLTRPPLKSSHSADDILKKPSLPKLPKKPQLKSEESRSTTDAAIVDRPPLPVKLKDLPDIDSPSFSKPKGSSNCKEDLARASDNVSPITHKSRTFGRESSEATKARLDQWKKLSTDFESSTNSFASRVPVADYAVVEFASPNVGTNRSKESVHATHPGNEASKSKVANQKVGSDRVFESTNGKEQKALLADEIFPPFEPSSSVRVSPTPKAPTQDGLVRFHSNSIARKGILNPTAAIQKEALQKTPSEAPSFQTRDGQRKNDDLVTRTNYLVSVQKTEAKETVAHQKIPLMHQPFSAESLIVNKESRDVPHTRRFLSEDLQSHPNDQIENGTDSVDAGGEYAVVDKNYRTAEEDSPYEVIWTGSKPKQNISKPAKPRRVSDEPPSLPPRTVESYILADDDDSQTNAKQNTKAEASNSNDVNSEQSSFQWLSAGVDKFKKLAYMKGAFSMGSKPNLRQSNQQESSSSAFYTSPSSSKDSNANLGKDGRSSIVHDVKDRVFPHRLHQKPRGPRKHPSHWMDR